MCLPYSETGEFGQKVNITAIIARGLLIDTAREKGNIGASHVIAESTPSDRQADQHHAEHAVTLLLLFQQLLIEQQQELLVLDHPRYPQADCSVNNNAASAHYIARLKVY